MRGAKVVVVVVSVFNTLNTIDCRVGGLLRDAGITLAVRYLRSGQERKCTFMFWVRFEAWRLAWCFMS